MDEKPLPLDSNKKGPKMIIELDLKIRPLDLVHWLLAVGLGAWGGWLLYRQAMPYPSEPPSTFSLILIALGFAAFFFFPETNMEG